MKKLSKDHLIDGRVYSAGTEYKIQEGSNNWPTLTKDDWWDMSKLELQQYLKRNDVDERDDIRWTALMWASKYSGPQVVQTLLDYGAYMYAEDVAGNTPLTIAIKHNTNSKVVQVLRDNGARK